MVRATGLADVLPVNEPKALASTAHHYGLRGPPSAQDSERLAEAWRPFRTWAVVVLRAAAP